MPSRRENAGQNQADRRAQLQEGSQGRRDQVSQNRQDRTGQRQENRGDLSGNRQDRLDQRWTNRSDQLDQRYQNRSDLLDQRWDRAGQVHDDLWHHRGDWHHGNWWHWRGWQRPGYWWGWATGAAVTSWFGWGASYGEPQYYDYGSTVVYEGDTVYVEGQPAGNTEEYAEQAIQLAEQGSQDLAAAPPPEEPVDDPGAEQQWMPLGVFALANEEKGEPIMFFQLAVDKEGTVSGTYYNSTTQQRQPVAGKVDRQSQKAAWSVGDKTDTVIETGIFNLTEDVAPALIHFGTERTQEWLLVRMENEEEAQSPQAPTAASSSGSDG